MVKWYTIVLLLIVNKYSISGLLLKKSLRASNSFINLFLYSFLTSIWSKGLTLSFHFLSQNSLEKHWNLVLALIALTHFIVKCSTFLKEMFSVIIFSVEIIQCTKIISSFTYFINFKHLFVLPFILGAPSAASRNIFH